MITILEIACAVAVIALLAIQWFKGRADKTPPPPTVPPVVGGAGGDKPPTEQK